MGGFAVTDVERLRTARDKIALSIPIIESYGTSPEIKNLILEITIATRELEMQSREILNQKFEPME